MKKLLAILLILAMMLSLCACAGEEANTPKEPDGHDQPAADPDEPKEPAPEPPIEVSDIGPVDESLPAPFDGEAPADFTDETHGITVGGSVYTPEWLYYHNIHDWVQVGMTYDDVSAKTGELIGFDSMTSAAVDVLKAKISDFTMLIMLESSDGSSSPAPSITVGDETYDFEWLTSHNATEYTEAGIPAATLKEYMTAIEDSHGYTKGYRWLEVVYDRLVNGW